MRPLPPTDFQQVQPLLASLDEHLVIFSLLASITPGHVYVDQPGNPQVALIDAGYRVFLAGSPQDRALSQSLNRLLTRQVIPQAKAAGRDALLLHLADPTWDTELESVLAGLYPLWRLREYYECTRLREDWRPLLPSGFALQPVTAELVARDELENVGYLREELCSERPSIEDFLARSFGFCVLDGSSLAGWALSEYNLAGRCEVGIATIDEYQRRGLGTVTALALVEYALANGYSRIGWLCWKSNVASSALARRAGFEYVRGGSVSLCVFDLGVQFALHGLDHTRSGEYQTALSWFERANAAGSAPAWTGYEAARCLARLGQTESAISQLRLAVSRGFDNLNAIRTEGDFDCLHHHSEWKTLLPDE
jgi:GNAT superfamily N-acetyltransferase